MSTTASSYSFRCRTIGRAASPPTWACYEQIPYDDDFSDSASESCSEDEEDYSRGNESCSDSEGKDPAVAHGGRLVDDSHHDFDMDMDEEGDGEVSKKAAEALKDVKGKQRAIEEEPEKSPRQRKKRAPTSYALRPILTIQRSQGFVWNQDLFIPPYIKDRYVASTSPPNSREFISTSVSSTNSALTDYEVEVVEIRVKEGDLDYLMP
ncbi:hypothetical protein H0H92_014627 [Tricholoma furcatifolium]|nr:hypothetical protein H0H92_014627 [Tricholoma furcatifolium]